MEKFNRALRGYDPKEVNDFIDSVIVQVEKMITEIKNKDNDIIELKKMINTMNEQINRYKAIETTLNRTIVAAQDSGEQIRRIARQESDMIVGEARKNANRIVSDALSRAERAEYDATIIRKNILLYKTKIRSIIESQLEIIDQIGNDNNI